MEVNGGYNGGLVHRGTMEVNGGYNWCIEVPWSGVQLCKLL